MRTLGSATLFVAVLAWAVSRSSVAQQTVELGTLEDLVTPDEPQDAGAQEQPAEIPKIPAGTVRRPEGGMQHPALEKAWADYEVAVAKVAEDLGDVIGKQFDAATAKGDLEAAVKWQTIGRNFEKEGVLPDEAETKTTVNAAVSTYRKAKDELARAYDAVVKALTIEKKIDEAKKARDEKTGLFSVAVTKPKTPAQPEATKVSWVDITSEMRGGVKQGAITVIRPQDGRVVSDRPYSPPLVIEYVCATSRNNIRLGYACDYLIFNWELNRNELRINGGPVGEQHVMNAGAVPVGKMVTIRQEVLPREMTIYVDGQKRASWAGDFSNVRDLIEVFGHDSDLQLKSVRVATPLRQLQQ